MFWFGRVVALITNKAQLCKRTAGTIDARNVRRRETNRYE